MKYKWMSMTAGNLEENIWAVLKCMVFDLYHYHFLNWHWKYDKNGF